MNANERRKMHEKAFVELIRKEIRNNLSFIYSTSFSLKAGLLRDTQKVVKNSHIS